MLAQACLRCTISDAVMHPALGFLCLQKVPGMSHVAGLPPAIQGRANPALPTQSGIVC